MFYPARPGGTDRHSRYLPAEDRDINERCPLRHSDESRASILRVSQRKRTMVERYPPRHVSHRIRMRHGRTSTWWIPTSCSRWRRLWPRRTSAHVSQCVGRICRRAKPRHLRIEVRPWERIRNGNVRGSERVALAAIIPSQERKDVFEAAKGKQRQCQATEMSSTMEVLRW